MELAINRERMIQVSAYFRRIFAVLIAVFTAIGSFFTGIGNAAKHDFTLELSSNPSTGCSWEVSIDNENAVKFSGSRYKADLNLEGASGKGGTEYFYFDAAEDGKATVTLTYGHQWEDDGIFRTVVVELESANSKLTVLNISDSEGIL